MFVQFGGYTKQHPAVLPKFSEGDVRSVGFTEDAGLKSICRGERSFL